MTATTKHSNNLTARQRARAATEYHQKRLKLRQARLTDAFAALDARTQATIAAGEAIDALKTLGGTNATIASELGLSTREVSQLLHIAARAGDGYNPADNADNAAADADPDGDSDRGSGNAGSGGHPGTD